MSKHEGQMFKFRPYVLTYNSVIFWAVKPFSLHFLPLRWKRKQDVTNQKYTTHAKKKKLICKGRQHPLPCLTCVFTFKLASNARPSMFRYHSWRNIILLEISKFATRWQNNAHAMLPSAGRYPNLIVNDMQNTMRMHLLVAAFKLTAREVTDSITFSDVHLNVRNLTGPLYVFH